MAKKGKKNISIFLNVSTVAEEKTVFFISIFFPARHERINDPVISREPNESRSFSLRGRTESVLHYSYAAQVMQGS